MGPDPEPICRKCGEPKSYMKTWKTPRLACLPCMDKSQSNLLGSTPIARVKDCRRCCKPKTLSIYKRRQVWECLPCVRINSIMREYGASRQRATELSLIDRCQSCGGSSVDKRGLHIDHDHGTGEIRGVLCDRCNKSLGLLDDNIIKIIKLARYLEENS